MEDVKGLLASRTVWGGLLALAAGIAGIFGYTITAADTAELANLGAGVASAIGGLVAIFGRIKATKKIA